MLIKNNLLASCRLQALGAVGRMPVNKKKYNLD